LADHEIERGNLGAASASLDWAMPILESMHAAQPRRIGIGRDLAECYGVPGKLEFAHRRWDNALVWYRKSLELW